MSNSSNPREFTRTSSPHDEWIAMAKAEAGRCRGAGSSSNIMGRSVSFTDADPARIWSDLSSRYEVAGEIRRGGQGVVYRGVQRGTRREVAIKVLRAGLPSDDATRVRFEREAQILAQLKHPNIVTVLENGVAGEAAFYVMDYIPGAPLDEYVRAKRSSPRESVALFAKVCDAVNVAHLRGIVHRDLKPSNVRVNPAGEPYVLDFGLAKISEVDGLASGSGELHTMTGQFLGSLPWASPEQVAARPDRLDIRTDVYSLGVVLFQLLTARFPYRVDAGMREALEHICNTPAPAPSLLNSGLDDDLDQIVLKCLQKDPEKRYQSAGDLARELRRYLAGEPIEAKRDSAWYVLRKRLQRYRVATAVGVLMVGLAATALATTTLFYQNEHRMRTDAENARKESERLGKVAEDARAASAEAEKVAREQAKLANAINEFFNTQVIIQATPDRMGRDVPLRDVLIAASATVDETAPDDPRTRAEIHYSLSSAFRSIGDVARCKRHAQRAYEIAGEVYGEEAPFTLLCASNFAQALNEAGKLREAGRMFERILDVRTRTLGRDDEDTIVSIDNLGWCWYQLGKAKEALPLLREAYERSLKRVGPENAHTLVAMHNLATVLADMKEFDEAMTLRAAHAEAAERLYGPENESTLRSRGQLALLKSYTGDYDEAIRIFREVAEKQSKRLGPAHNSTLLTLNNLATVLVRSGRMEEAIPLLADTLEKAAGANVSQHPLVVTMKSNLGEMYTRTQRYAEALPLAQEALEAAEKIYPAGHAYLGLYHMRLGRALLGLKRYDEAEPELREGQRILAAASGEDDQETREAVAALKKLEEERAAAKQSSDGTDHAPSSAPSEARRD